MSCPCRAFLLLFVHLFFFCFNLLCASLSFLWCSAANKRRLKRNRLESTRLLKNRRVAVNFSFGATLPPKVCKLAPLRPRGTVQNDSRQRFVSDSGMAGERQPSWEHELAVIQPCSFDNLFHIYTLLYPLECASIA